MNRMLLTLAILPAAAAAERPELIGVADFSGTASDLSTLSDTLRNGEPHNRLGGFSALEYTGSGDLYVALPDRGPDDGETGYLCRTQTLEVRVDPAATPAVTARVVETTILRDELGRPFSGDARRMTEDNETGVRFDPEGLRFADDGSFWVSEEYGPQVVHFTSAGKAVERLDVPDYFRVTSPADSKKAENAANVRGRASNKGMEGLAISPDGRTLTGIMQHVLLQDGDRVGGGKPKGRNVRIVQFDLESGDVREFVYVLEDGSLGISEILSLDANRFLVLERDGEPGEAAGVKGLAEIDLSDATDVHGVESLPHGELPASIVPARKRPYLDMLDAAYGLAGAAMPEKIEGLTFGPTLADGRRTLLLSSDNDFEADAPSRIFVFAVDAPSDDTVRVESLRPVSQR